MHECITYMHMEKPVSPVTFRASPEDRKIIGELTKWLGLRMSSVIKLALRRLHDEEASRHALVSSEQNVSTSTKKSSRKKGS